MLDLWERNLSNLHIIHTILRAHGREHDILQGESLPLRGTVGQLMDKLASAGVGQRPVVFICHR